jgi:AcrR family transcriptional regulator
MATEIEVSAQPRGSLSRERVLRAAVAFADQAGVESVSMRKIAQELGVVPMALYKHLSNKNEMLDGMVDMVMDEINEVVNEVEGGAGDWKTTMRHRVLTARRVLLRHPWAPRLMESRTNMSAGMLRYHDSLIGLLREAGFSIDLTHHALHALGSRALGFTQELYEDSEDLDAEAISTMLRQMGGQYPHIAEMISEISHDDDSTLGWCDDQVEFEFALDLILGGLERLRDTPP